MSMAANSGNEQMSQEVSCTKCSEDDSHICAHEMAELRRERDTGLKTLQEERDAVLDLLDAVQGELRENVEELQKRASCAVAPVNKFY
jgi:hypothetical protein